MRKRDKNPLWFIIFVKVLSVLCFVPIIIGAFWGIYMYSQGNVDYKDKEWVMLNPYIIIPLFIAGIILCVFELYKKLTYTQKKNVNEKPIEVSGFRIFSKGDPSVGIFSAEWELTGPFFFDNKEDLEGFKIKIREAYEYVADDAVVKLLKK